MKHFFAGFFAVLVSCAALNAQSLYSFEGIGSLEHQGMSNNFAMGEVGIGAPSLWNVNTQNPANLVYNTFSTFQVGLELDSRRFQGEDISGDDTNGSLRFLAYAFPIVPAKWSSSFGILPYSTVNYNTFSESVLDEPNNINQITDDRGEGGLTHFFWAHGFRIKKKLMIGVRANYTFGSINKESRIFIQQTEVDDDGEEISYQIGNSINYTTDDSYSDLNFVIGLGYRHIIAEKTFINLGMTYSPRTDLNGNRELALTRLTNTGGDLDSQDLGTFSLDAELPQSVGFGISYQKQNQYTIALDIENQRWSDLESEENSFTDFSKVAFGLNWVPDFDNVSSYLKRAKYSFGFNRSRLPYVVNGQTLIDFGINFGASLPVSGFSSIDFAVKWGQLGETSNGLIRENYFKIVIGASINDRWFIQRRYD